MAIDQDRNSPQSDFSGRHLAIGTNVVLSIVIALTLVVVSQWVSFKRNTRVDLTSSRLNSLTTGTEYLVSDLDQKVRLASLYFETDIEDEDQARYRERMDDLLSLYQRTNPSMVEIRSINPLQDHAKRDAFVDELRGLKVFSEETQPYEALAERFKNELLGQINELLQGQSEKLAGIVETTSDETAKIDLGQIQMLLEDRERAVAFATEDVRALVDGASPQYGVVQQKLVQLYSGVVRDLNNILSYCQQLRVQRTSMPEAVSDYVNSVDTAYRSLIARLEGETTNARGLGGLEFDGLVRQLGPMSNALVVYTDEQAKVVRFDEIWPAADPRAVEAGFGQRIFRGEEKVTSAILQLTVAEKTAVVFARFGGQSLFAGGRPGMPGMGSRPGPYAKIKAMLEDANFVVEEWDVASMETPPELDPPPVRTIFVVLRPINPPPGGQPQSQGGFNDLHRQRVVGALGEHPRAIFVAGWLPGAFGDVPEPYPYDGYLADDWGIHVASDMVVLRAFPYPGKPGEMAIGQESFVAGEFSRSDHAIVRGMVGKRGATRLACPIEISGSRPEGVVVDKLLWMNAVEGLWGVRDFTKYEKNVREGKPVSRQEGDATGPFTVAVAGEAGDGKIVVVSGRAPFSDEWALARGGLLTSRGITTVLRNPGNVHLFINSLHWLNDRTEWLDVGKPVDIGTIAIDERSGSMRVIKAFAYVGWPATALLAGGVVWWMRRR